MKHSYRNLDTLLKALKPAGMAPADPCPDETLLAEYFEGMLMPEAEQSLLSHLGDCSACRQTLIACVEILAPEKTAGLFNPVSSTSDMLEAELKAMETSLNLDSALSRKTPGAGIMVVDDDPIYLRALADTLSGEFNVTACVDGHTALQNARSGQYRVIVLDIKMACMSGLEVARRLKADLVSAPIIFNTGYPGEFVREDIEQHYRPFGYVTKDDPDALFTHVRRAAELNIA
jgi:CheY-like chemotaxis protein